MSSLFRRIPHTTLFGLVLVFLFTWPIDLALAAQGRGLLPFEVPAFLGSLVGYGFVAAALIATQVDGGLRGVIALLRRYLIWDVGVRWWAIVLLGPAVLILLALAIDVALGGPTPNFASPFVRNFVPAGLAMWIVVPGWFLFEALTNGEEIFWRGYLLPRWKERFGARTAALLVGLVWALWHLPKFWLVGVVGGAHDYPFWLLAANTIAFSLLLTWVFQHTRGSLLLATVFHAASNTAFMCLPIPAGERAFVLWISLTSIVALVVALTTGPDLTRRRRQDAQGEMAASSQV